jgi:hypothetical protein
VSSSSPPKLSEGLESDLHARGNPLLLFRFTSSRKGSKPDVGLRRSPQRAAPSARAKARAIAVAEVSLSTAVHRLVINGGRAPAEFASLVGAFGPLPEDGINELAERMLLAVGIYGLEKEEPRQ